MPPKKTKSNEGLLDQTKAEKSNEASLKEIVSEFPQTAGVYLMLNDKDKIIYVGKAKNLRARVRSYFHENADHSIKTKYLVSHIRKIDYLLTKTEVEAFLLEASLIKKHRPRYNIRLKDDKSYPYIRCQANAEFPRFQLARKVAQDGAVYFGPYTSGLAVRETIRFVNRTFKIRDCSDAFMKSRKRPCMTYQIGRCTAPCVNLVSVDEYKFDLKSALSFLQGYDKKVLKDLKQRMKAAADEERFEAAAKIRDSMNAVEVIWEKQSVVNAGQQADQDVIGFVGGPSGTLVEILNIRKGRLIGQQSHFLAQVNCESQDEDIREWLISFLNQYYSDNFIPDEVLLPLDLDGDINRLFSAVLLERGKKSHLMTATGQKAKALIDMALQNAKSRYPEFVKDKDDRDAALKDIQSKFNLPHWPRRLECFDISNFQGSDNVASQVVFEDGIPKKEDYRLYKIKTFEGANDFAAMKEVLSRRFKHKEYDEPDLIVVDGGKGQLKMALSALQELGFGHLKVVGLAKARTQGHFSDAEVESTEERFFLPGRQNPIVFRQNSMALQILVGLRDEAHRFAITYHRKLRGKGLISSELDEIVGLGEKRKTLLLKKFGSIDEIKKLSADELAALPTFHRVLVERVVLHFQNDSTLVEESDSTEESE